jgi:ethanolamine utilization protein EutN
MFLARVVGEVIATHRHGELEGRKLLLIRRLSTTGHEEGGEVVALDVIGVGVGERVLVVQGGGGRRGRCRRARAFPRRRWWVGVVDRVDLEDGEVPEEGR